MGSSVPDICFDGKLNAYKSLLKKTIQIEDGDAKVVKLEGLIRNLEVERTKIGVFHRELPLCVQLLSDVIEWLKEELEGCQKGPVFEELMPMKSKFEEDRRLKVQNDAKDKKNWMSSVQLWSHNDEAQKADKNSKISNKRPRESTSAQTMQFQIFSRKEERFELGVNGISVNLDSSNQVVMQSQQRKTRRSWSDELHRRFISALNQLGGPQVATPKQIRELMNVDGLTNDEVKSHLQKYRMHTKRIENNFDKDSWLKPKEQHYSSSQQSTSQSGSPTGPLHFPVYNGGAVSFTAGESCELEEDGRSESYGFFK